MTLPAQLFARACEEPDAPLILDADGQVHTNARFYDDCLKLASVLESLGIQRRDRVATLLDNEPFVHVAWVACALLGAMEVPINPEFKGASLIHGLNDSQAKVLLTTGGFLDRINDVDERLTNLEVLLVRGSSGEGSAHRQLVQLDDLLPDAKATPREGPCESDPYAVVYTSGTTGEPKGVVAPWGLMTSSLDACFPEHTPGDNIQAVMYNPWPCFHASGKSGLVAVGAFRGTLVMRRRFSVSSFWQDIRTFGCTHVNLLGLAPLLLAQPPRSDDSENPLQKVLMLPLPPNYREFERRFDVRVSTAWGMTEIGMPLSTPNPPNSSTCGRLQPGFEARLADELDYEVPEGAAGEFIVRTSEPWRMMTEYLGRPDATASAWRNGWFHTGDTLRRDADGNYYFVDRVADYIRSRGHNISSLEVESEVLTHPLVAECACIGVRSSIAELYTPDPDAPDRSDVMGDDDVKIVVVTKSGAELTEEQLISYLIDRLPRFQVPRYVEFVDRLPRTPTEKVRKAELRRVPFSEATWDRVKAGIEVPR